MSSCCADARDAAATATDLVGPVTLTYSKASGVREQDDEDLHGHRRQALSLPAPLYLRITVV
jgi:hypothetical protein